MTTTAAPLRASLVLSRDALAAALAATVPVIRRNSTLPILQTVRWDGQSLTATDLDVTVTVPLPGDGEDEAVCLHGTTFSTLVRALQKGDVSVAWTEREATVTASGDRFTLQGMPAVEFPLLVTVDGPSLTIPSNELLTRLQAVRHMVASGHAESAARPLMTGVHFRERDGSLVIEATDSHRLVQYPSEVDAPVALSCCVPGPAIDRLIGLLGTTEDAVVTVTVEPTRLAAEVAGSWRLVTRLIEGRFPDIDRVIPNDNDTLACRLPAAEWMAALSRISVMASEVSHRVEIELAGGRAVMQSSDEKRGKGQVAVSYEPITESAVVTLALNGVYLRELLANLPSDGTVTLKVGRKGRYLLFEGSGALAVLAPLVDR